MDAQSLNFAPSTKPRKPKKLSKKEKKLLKKKRKSKNRKGEYWAPIDKTNCITLHLVHRSTNDPLLNIPDEGVGEWVLEPEVNCRSDYERVQKFFSEFDLEDTIPHHYRTDEFIEKTSAKSMPILPSQQRQSHANTLGPIFENGMEDTYDYEQHYRSINDSNFVSTQSHKKEQQKKKRLKDGVEILEQYNFDEDYESDGGDNKDNNDDEENLPEHLKEYEPETHLTDKQLQQDPNYRDYMDLLLSDEDVAVDDEQKYDTKDVVGEFEGDLQDDFVIQAMGIDEDEFKRIQIGDFVPYGARFAKWDEMDIHNDKYNKNTINPNSTSLYDQTINRLINMQQQQAMNGGHGGYLDDINEESESGQFDDAESDEEYDDMTGIESIPYDKDKSLLDNQFEMMLHKDYGDEFIGELDDEMDELQGDFNNFAMKRFSNYNKKESLRYKYYMYLKHRHRRIRQSLKKSNRAATLQLLGIDENDKNEQNEEELDEVDGDELMWLSGSDSDHKKDEVDIKDLDSDDERRIDYEIEQEFKKKPPPKWDCESILSTRTNHENHPVELDVNKKKRNERNVVKLDKTKFIEFGKDGMLKNEDKLERIEEVNGDKEDDEVEMTQDVVFNFGAIGGGDVEKEAKGKQIIFEFKKFNDDAKCDNDLEEDEDEEDVDENEANEVTAYSNRKGETKEERKMRKKLKKELKQQRRREKSANKKAFKEATKRQNKLSMTQRKSHGNALRL